MSARSADLAVSVIVVSRGRPDALRRCLAGIEQLFSDNFELIVVADPAGAAVVPEFGDSAKLVVFDKPNISAARNLGIAQAGGELVAFIDDDSVPEPSWLDHLVAPFSAPDVAAAGGFVRARNGISFQSTAQTIDACGWPTQVEVPEDQVTVIAGQKGRAIKTEGTNCAFRRDVLAELGGFDPSFHFYMDETDLNLRLAAEGRKTAIVPMAQVHHGFAASAQRHGSRLPRTLFDVGASSMLLLRKHAAPEQYDTCLARLRAEQRARMHRHMVAGNCEPRDLVRILRTLEEGIAEGRQRTVAPLLPLRGGETAFRRFPGRRDFAGSTHLAGRFTARHRLRQKAAEMVQDGQRVSLFLFSPTTLFHRVSFDSSGYWEQSGGVFGKSLRSDPIFRIYSFESRLKREVERAHQQRAFRK